MYAPLHIVCSSRLPLLARSTSMELILMKLQLRSCNQVIFSDSKLLMLPNSSNRPNGRTGLGYYSSLINPANNLHNYYNPNNHNNKPTYKTQTQPRQGYVKKHTHTPYTTHPLHTFDKCNLPLCKLCKYLQPTFKTQHDNIYITSSFFNTHSTYIQKYKIQSVQAFTSQCFTDV